MRIRLIGSVLEAFALLAISPAMQAQTSPKLGRRRQVLYRPCLEVGKGTARYP